MIVDHQDDLGTFLRQTAPGIAESPFIKHASWQEKPEMLEREFAIILVEPNGREHRKLAMNDAGNTLASITYLLTKDHNLSDSAVKLASYNLLNSAMHYGLYDAYGDNLLRHEKLGSAFDVLAMLADSLVGEDIIDERRVHVKTAIGVPRNYEASSSSAFGANPTVAVAGKSQFSMGGGMMAPKQAPMGAAMPQPSMPKYASSYDLIKEAKASWADIDPVDKRKFALIIKEAAAQEGADVPNFIHQYTGHELNPDFEMVMTRRKDYVANPSLQEDYDRLSKVAYAMDLADATEALYLLDEQAGLLNRYNSRLPDPVLSVYGTTKEAMWSWNHGGDYCTVAQLTALSVDPVKRKHFEDIFSKECCKDFCKDPVKFFESRPIEQQIIMSRMANSTGM